MGAALEGARIEADLAEQPLHHGHVAGLAAVRGARDGELLVAEVEALGGAAFHEGDRLQGLHGRAREDRPQHIADGGDHAAIGIADGDGAAVRRFENAAACGFGEDGVEGQGFAHGSTVAS